jgi:hypothetical protein
MNQKNTVELLLGRGHSSLQRLVMIASVGLLAACGGGDVGDDQRRLPLAVTTQAAPVYDRDDLYRFFSIAFGAAPGVTYMGQLVEAADYGLSIKQIVNIFTTKPQFLETYPATLSNREYAQKLVDNVVGTSASAAAKAEAVEDIVAALSLPGWTRGDITYAIFNNLAKKPAEDMKWAGTAKKMANQVTYAKHFTESMKVDTTDLKQLRAVVMTVTENSPVIGADLGSLIQKAIQTATLTANNAAPLANAGLDQRVVIGTTVNLDGSRSSDANGDAITYSWAFASRPLGSAAVFNSTTTSTPQFTVDVDGSYVATLQVSDGMLTSTPTTVNITAVQKFAGALSISQSNSYDFCGISGTFTEVSQFGSGVWTLNNCRVFAAAAGSVIYTRFQNNSSSSVKLTNVNLTIPGFDALLPNSISPNSQLIPAQSFIDFAIPLSIALEVTNMTATFIIEGETRVVVPLATSLRLP